MNADVITIDDSSDDDDHLMEVTQKQKGEAASTSAADASVPCSSSTFVLENLSYSSFTPFSLAVQRETADDDDYDSDEMFDPTEEIDFDDPEAMQRYENNPIPNNIFRESKISYSYTKNEDVNEMLNSMPVNFKWSKFLDQLPEDFIKQQGGKDAAYKELSYFVKENQQQNRIERVFEWIKDLARKSGASEEDIKQTDKIPELEAVTAKIKKEIWDSGVEEAARTASPNFAEGGNVVEVGDEEETYSQSSPPENSIMAEAEPEYIVIDDD